MISYRKRLLASTVTTILGGAALIAPQAASAACVVTATTVVCGPTTTVNTTFPTNSVLGTDRNYPVDTSTAAFTGTVSTGALVDGFGLAFTNTVGGTNALNVINNGTVQINAGNSASAGGGSVLQVNAIGATPVNYSGEGNIINNGTLIGHGLDFFMSGTGNLIATVGVAGGATTTITTAAPASAAIQVNHTAAGLAGNVTITTTSDTTLRASLAGINIDAGGTGSMSVTNAATIGSLTTAPNTLADGIRVIEGATGTGSISVSNTGAIGLATDRTTNSGINTAILNAASAAPISVTGTGAIFTSGTGIIAANAGTGSNTVNYTGAINTTGATGVSSTATTGATTVTTGAVTAAANGIVATSTSGTQTITANGAVAGTTGSGISSTTTGTRTIAVGTAGNVTGGTQAILLVGTGATTVNNNGIVGAAATGLAINNTGTGAVTLNNNTTGTLNGRVTFNAGADTFSNTGIFNTQGVTDFGAGVDAFSNTALGVVNITGNTTFSNLETFTQNARINLNAFTLTSSAIPFVNGLSGFIDTSGNASILGFTALTNNGTIDLAGGIFTVPAGVLTNSLTGVIIADEGPTTITGQSSVSNAGTIDLQDGANGDVLTINSAYAGVNGRLQVDTTNTLSDQLIVGNLTGTTFIDVAGLSNGFINPVGVLVVDGTGTSTTGAFLIGNQSGSPFINYDIRQAGSDYFIVSGPSAAAFQPLVLSAAAADIWYQSADEVIAQLRVPNDLDGPSVWGQVYGSKDKSGENDLQILNGFAVDADNKTDNTRYGFQLGADIGLGGIGRIGLTGGLERAEVDGAIEVDLRGWNLGVYGQVGGPLGFHAEGFFKHDRFKTDVNNGPFIGENSRGRSTGVDGAIGYRFPAGWVASIDVNAGISHVWTKLGGVSALNFAYDYDRFTSTRGRVGVRANFGGRFNPYIDVTGYREFDGDTSIDLFDGVNVYEINRDGKGSYARLEGGLAGSGGFGPMLAVWGDFGDRKGAGIRAGFRFGGHREEMLPPPPPPAPMAEPAPPPPATQTCSDGSVILATDACPPPPPPPPPAPEPERG